MEGRTLVDTLIVDFDRRTTEIGKVTVLNGYYDKVKILCCQLPAAQTPPCDI